MIIHAIVLCGYLAAINSLKKGPPLVAAFRSKDLKYSFSLTCMPLGLFDWVKEYWYSP